MSIRPSPDAGAPEHAAIISAGPCLCHAPVVRIPSREIFFERGAVQLHSRVALHVLQFARVGHHPDHEMTVSYRNLGPAEPWRPVRTNGPQDVVATCGETASDPFR